MKYKEYGSKDKPLILLLHGGGLSWWNYKEVAEFMKNDYHIILPILDGHAGSDYPFTTIENNAMEILSFLDGINKEVLLIGGLSLGGQIVVEMLSKRKDICKYALIESASVLPSPLINACISLAINSTYGLIQNRYFSKLQFHSLHIKKEFFEDYYRDTCLIQKEDMIAFLKGNTIFKLKNSFKESLAKICIYVGENEIGKIKQSAEIMHRMHPSSQLNYLPNLKHGEFSINYPEQYADAIYRITRGE